MLEIKNFFCYKLSGAGITKSNELGWLSIYGMPQDSAG